MTRPITIEDADYKGANDEDSAFSQDRREQDLTMLHYIRNMPETVKFNAEKKKKIGQVNRGGGEMAFDRDEDEDRDESYDDVASMSDNWGG